MNIDIKVQRKSHHSEVIQPACYFDFRDSFTSINCIAAVGGLQLLAGCLNLLYYSYRVHTLETEIFCRNYISNLQKVLFLEIVHLFNSLPSKFEADQMCSCRKTLY